MRYTLVVGNGPARASVADAGIGIGADEAVARGRLDAALEQVGH